MRLNIINDPFNIRACHSWNDVCAWVVLNDQRVVINADDVQNQFLKSKQVGYTIDFFGCSLHSNIDKTRTAIEPPSQEYISMFQQEALEYLKQKSNTSSSLVLGPFVPQQSTRICEKGNFAIITSRLDYVGAIHQILRSIDVDEYDNYFNKQCILDLENAAGLKQCIPYTGKYDVSVQEIILRCKERGYDVWVISCNDYAFDPTLTIESYIQQFAIFQQLNDTDSA